MHKVLLEEAERVAQIYKTNSDASSALGVTSGSFTRICREYGIETPYARGRRVRKECSDDE